MGSWNETCMISNLPIRYDDNVKLVFLHSNRTISEKLLGKSSFVYHNDIMTPSFLPLTGKYNDYGVIGDIIEDWNYHLIVKYLKNQLGNIIFVDGKRIEDWKISDLIKGIERGNITYPYHGGDKKDSMFNLKMRNGYTKEYAEQDDRDLMLSFVLIREDVWNYIIENYIGDKMNFHREGDEEFHISVDHYLRKQYKKHIESIKKIQEIENDPNISDTEKVGALMRFSFDGKVNMFSPEYSNYTQLLASYDYADYFKDNENKWEELYDDWRQLAKIHEFISDARKSWMVQSGAGSQDESFDTNRLLSNCVISVCDKIDREEY